MKQRQHLARLRDCVRLLRVVVRYLSADVLSLWPTRPELEQRIQRINEETEQLAAVLDREGGHGKH